MSNSKKAKALIKKLGLMPSNILTPHALSKYFALSISARDNKDRLAGIYSVGNGEGYLGKSHTGVSSGLVGGYTYRIAIIGKGITFDSGGISIKPSHNMEDMKFDMLGAATVLGLEKTLEEAKHSIDLYGCIAENVFGPGMNRPGDVIEYADNTRAEIINTDAEGRLVLADGIIEAKRTHPDLIITIATLTGAARAALGDATAVFSNQDELAQKFVRVAKQVGEDAWQLPIFEHHRKAIKADKRVADIKNSVSIAGASTAAAFLEHFVKDTPWIHLDIAGSAYKDKQPTAVMLDTITEFLLGEHL